MKADLCLFWKVGSVTHHFSRRIQWWLLQKLIYAFFGGWGVIYHQGLFFKGDSVVAVARADLCLFWKVGSVIYHQRSFFKENSVMVVA